LFKYRNIEILQLHVREEMKSATMKTIAAGEVSEGPTPNAPIDVIDVRTPAEFEEVHATLTSNVPLDALDAEKFLTSRRGREGKPVYILCRTGNRACQACEKFLQAGFDNVYVVEGGIESWVNGGLPIVRGRKTMSIERQVRVVAGSLILLGVLLGYTNIHWIWLSGFVGAGLVFTGITDSCVMGMILARMPWNQRKSCDR